MIRSHLLPLAALFALTGCGQESGVATPAPPQAASGTDNRPIYSVYFDAGQFAPFVMFDANNQPTGFDRDIIEAVAAKQGFRLTYTPHYWTGIFANLGNGADIVIAGVTITNERRAQMDFSDPYFENFPALLVLSDSPIHNFADIQNKKIAVVKSQQAASTLQSLLGGGGQTVTVDTTWEAVRSVIRKEADGAFNDIGPLAYYAERYKDQKLEVVVDSNAPKEYYGFPVAKGNTELLNKINAGLKQIRQDGTYDRIYAKWFASERSFQAMPTPASAPVGLPASASAPSAPATQ